VSVPLELEDDKMFELMRMAHEQDITLNQLVENILRNMIAEKEITV
jgi:predicted HicB family RNase H-like nuclease